MDTSICLGKITFYRELDMTWAKGKCLAEKKKKRKEKRNRKRGAKRYSCSDFRPVLVPV